MVMLACELLEMSARCETLAFATFAFHFLLFLSLFCLRAFYFLLLLYFGFIAAVSRAAFASS